MVQIDKRSLENSYKISKVVQIYTNLTKSLRISKIFQNFKNLKISKSLKIMKNIKTFENLSKNPKIFEKSEEFGF